MDDALVVDVLEALDDAGGEEFGLEFWESSMSANMVAEVTAWE